MMMMMMVMYKRIKVKRYRNIGFVQSSLRLMWSMAYLQNQASVSHWYMGWTDRMTRCWEADEYPVRLFSPTSERENDDCFQGNSLTIEYISTYLNRRWTIDTYRWMRSCRRCHHCSHASEFWKIKEGKIIIDCSDNALLFIDRSSTFHSMHRLWWMVQLFSSCKGCISYRRHHTHYE